MNTAFNKYKFYNQLEDKFGETHQILLAAEEMSELTKELLKYIRYGTVEHIAEELADVENVLDQLKYIFGISQKEIEENKREKIERTIERYNLER